MYSITSKSAQVSTREIHVCIGATDIASVSVGHAPVEYLTHNFALASWAQLYPRIRHYSYTNLVVPFTLSGIGHWVDRASMLHFFHKDDGTSFRVQTEQSGRGDDRNRVLNSAAHTATSPVRMATLHIVSDRAPNHNTTGAFLC